MTMKHQFLRAAALFALSISLIGCSNSDIERVKASTKLPGSLLPAGMPLGEVVEHSKVCKSPKWERREDEHQQALVEFTCTVSVSDEMIEGQRQRSLKELERAVQDTRDSYPRMIERLSADAAKQKDIAQRTEQEEQARLSKIDQSIKTYETALTNARGQRYPRSWWTTNEQQLAHLRQERERLATRANGEGLAEQSQANAAILDAQKRLDGFVALEGKYKAAVQATEEAVAAELRARYAKTGEFRLRMVFRVPSEQPVSIHAIEWLSGGKNVPLRDGGPALFNAKDFDESMTRITQRSIYFDAASEFRARFPIECTRDSFGMVERCHEKA